MIVAMQKPHASVMTWKMTVYFEQSVQDEHLAAILGERKRLKK